MIARVVNSADQGFAEIQPALDHQSTRQGDTVWVCPGEYNENLAIPRPLCLKGMNAAKPVILRHDPEHAQTKLPLIDIRAKEGTVSISGFDFQSGQTAVTSDYAFESAVQLTGNTFAAGFANAITLYQNKPITIGDNRFGFPEHHSIYVHGSEHVNISDNEFDNILELSRDDLGRIYFEETAVYLLDVSKADITGNRSQTDFGIWGLRVKNIKIRDNHVDQMQRWGGYIVLNDTELANITDNSNFRVLLNKTLMSKIEGNTVNWRRRDGDELAMFDLANVVFLDVEHNNLRSAERGTFIGIKVSSGVDLVKLRHNKISNFNNGIACLGTFNMHNHKYGNKILDNRILNCGYAIYMYSSDNWSVDGNVLLENHTGLLLERSDDIRLGINIIRNSSGFLTGVHLDQSSARIENNHIAGNHGSGIALKNASDALIRGNNIVDNNPGVTNSQPDSVSANDNWWGSAGGPGADDISGAVRVQTWLPQPVNAVLSIPQDTLFLRDQRDSVAVLVNRFDGQADELNLTITDATGWMSSTADTALVLPDTGAAVCRIKFDGRQGGSGGWIKLNAVMQSDALSARDSLYVMSYTPVPAYITLTPDTVILTPGDSVRFSALCTDQYGQQQRTPFDWEAEGGSIDETGLFTAGEQSGEYQVQVSVPDQSVQQSAVVIISSDVRVEQPDEIPRDYCLYPASPNPFNPVTTLSFSVPEPARVTLHIYNIRGQRLWSHQPKVEAGRHQLRWQARDDQGRPLSSGLYILELRAGDSFRQVQKLLLVR
ncbi:MAG: NosD domain-containing protein [candidate division KSB1 bacterium]|nr:NosD domain-containing protein [candidate division KSB1 bacterium]